MRLPCFHAGAAVAAWFVGAGVLAGCGDNAVPTTRNVGGSQPEGGAPDVARDGPRPFDWSADGTSCTSWVPEDQTAIAYTEADIDGDGVWARWLQRCENGRVKTEAYGGDDCDDRDPKRTALIWRDEDGDHWAASGDVQCVGVVPAGYSTWRFEDKDCDDTDPTRQAVYYADEDGDLYGNKDSPRCSPFVPNDPMPPGLSRNARDCDDWDPHRNPREMEQWNDGVDSNCDGKDAPLDCSSSPQPCGCALLGTAPPAIDASCAGSDLFVAAKMPCSSCVGLNVIVIGNRGTAAVTRGFDILVGQHGPWAWEESRPVVAELAPGAISLPVVLTGELDYMKVVAPSATECDTTNNEADLVTIHPGCE